MNLTKSLPKWTWGYIPSTLYHCFHRVSYDKHVLSLLAQFQHSATWWWGDRINNPFCLLLNSLATNLVSLELDQHTELNVFRFPHCYFESYLQMLEFTNALGYRYKTRYVFSVPCPEGTPKAPPCGKNIYCATYWSKC